MSTTNPRITNDWDDIHRRLGNYLPLDEVVTEEEKTKNLVSNAESSDPLDSLTIKQLDTLEDIYQDKTPLLDDELKAYRQRRIEELKLRKKSYRFGSVSHIGKAEFIKEVTEASKELIQISPDSKPTETWVIVHVFSHSSTFSEKFNQLLNSVAHKFGSVKFTKGSHDDLIPGLPEEKLPLILIYKGGKCLEQIFGTKIWNNYNVTAERIEYVLANNYGILDSDLLDNHHKTNEKTNITKDMFSASKLKSSNSSDSSGDDDDDDYDEDSRGYSSLKLDQNKQRLRW